jgi:Tfp pilus assembly protein FimT
VAAATTVNADDAYDRGRRDERARRRGSPLMTFVLLIVVAIGAVLIYFAIQNGSFSRGGAVVDQKLSNAAATVQAPIRGAADTAGTALENAGSHLKQDAGSGKN